MQQTVLDKEAFCAQVIRHQDAMFRAAKAILRQDEDAEDAVQEAICSAFAARGGLRDEEKFKPWILRILANKCYDTCRKRRPTVDLEEVQDYLPAAGTDPTDRMTLWQAVMSLGDDLRAAVTLFYYDGLSIREIGTILGISEAAVKTRLSRGRARLRQLLREA
ncbi:RNA polymerase sigma factor [uncultured Oscillibacter sp.]|uniref:RNA polymerase sigma factor n=1 Tax=uncultured Oscillibacter sp. TaxID=876091 RepID=UPI0025EB4CB1|nr:sigma-70 family RNA polymerase sigma factor [uncultured Oscillibacter sp.]